MTRDLLLDAALAYRAAGFDPVFGAVGHNGKAHPIERGWTTLIGQTDAEIHERRDRHYRATALALIIGPRFVVIDIDRHRAGEDGEARLEELRAGRMLRPHAPTQLTHDHGFGRGQHSWRRVPDGMRLVQRDMGGGLQLKTGPSCVNVWPTPNYDWLISILEVEPPLIEGWLAELMLPKPAPEIEPTPQPYRAPSSDAETRRRRAYLVQAVHGEASLLASCPRGQRNAALNAAARRLGNLVAGEPGLLTEAEVRAALHAACIANGLIVDDSEMAFEKTFASGFSFGLKMPRAVPPPTPQRPPITRRAP